VRAFRLALGTAVLAAAMTVLVVVQGALPAYGAPALVQTGTVATSATKNVTLTMSGASTAGNLLIALVVGSGDASTATAPAGWVSAQQGSGSQSRRAAVFYYANNPGGISSAQFTFGPSTTFSAGQMVEFSGMATLSPVDVFGRNSATSSTTASASGNQSNNNQTSYANEIAVTVFMEDLSPAATASLTPGAGWTNFGNTGATSGTTQYTADYKTGIASGNATSETETSSVQSTAVGWEGMLVTFAPAPTCTGGSLSLSAQTVQFNSSTLNGKDKTATGSVTLTPTDNTGNNAGWNVQLTSTQFTVAGHTLSATATTVTSQSDSADGGTCAVPSGNNVGYPVTVPAGAGPPAAVKVYNAAANTGKGDSQLNLNFSMSLPASTFAGHYTSTWTFTIASGP